MVQELYVALLEAGVSEDKAKAAAVTCAGPYGDANIVLAMQREQHRILLRLKRRMGWILFLQTGILAWMIATLVL